MAVLALVIPTYNRAEKLKRLLQNLTVEIERHGIANKVEIRISDNASTDDTWNVAQKFCSERPYLSYYRQETNLGCDGNLAFLYRSATAKYVWFIGDDDIVLDGGVVKMLSILDQYGPDLVLFSFVQPRGNPTRQFDYPEPLHLVNSPAAMVEFIWKASKLTSYVLRRVECSEVEWERVAEQIGDGWIFKVLAFSVLEKCSSPSLVVVSEALASCGDEDYQTATDAYFSLWMLKMHRPFAMPFPSQHHPSWQWQCRNEGYRVAIQVIFADATGGFGKPHVDAIREMTGTMDWKWRALIGHPKSLMQLALLKSRLAWVYSGFRPLVIAVRALAAGRKDPAKVAARASQKVAQ